MGNFQSYTEEHTWEDGQIGVGCIQHAEIKPNKLENNVNSRNIRIPLKLFFIAFPVLLCMVFLARFAN